MENAVCGLACLLMIREFHGIELDQAALRARYAISQRGLSLRRLVAIAADIGMSARVIRTPPALLEPSQLPCVLHWKMSHFVVLVDQRPGAYLIHDPAVGRRWVDGSEFTGSFTGYAMLLSPRPEWTGDAALARRRVRIGEVSGDLGPLGRQVTTYVVLTLLVQALALTFPIQLKSVVDHPGGLDSGALELAAVWFLGIALGHALLKVWRRRRLINADSQIDRRWLENAFATLLQLPPSYFECRQAGEILSKFDSIDRIRQTVSIEFIDVLVDGAFCCFATAMMLVYSPTMAGITCIGITATLLMRWLIQDAAQGRSSEHAAALSRQTSYVAETVHGVQTIKLFGREAAWRARWNRLVAGRVDVRARMSHLLLVDEASVSVASNLARAFLLLYGALAVAHHRLAVGAVVACLGYSETLFPRLTSAANRLFEVALLRVHTHRLAEMMNHPPENPGGDSNIALDADGALRLRNVSFRYGDDERWVLRDVDLDLEPNETTLITGPSGSGKTTLLKLILGVLSPQFGEVTLAGRQRTAISMRAYRALFATVLQNDHLFAGSILENVSMFEDAPDTRHVEECLAAAGFADDLARLAMGIHTSVSENGDGFSGGQQQRILIARALYRRPRFLVLDEGTNQLDAANEARILASIKAQGCTVILISHRDLSRYDADARIVRVEDGRVWNLSRPGPDAAVTTPLATSSIAR